jgi:hypothetical protein
MEDRRVTKWVFQEIVLGVRDNMSEFLLNISGLAEELCETLELYLNGR